MDGQLGTKADNEALRQKLAAARADVTKLAKETSHLLQVLGRAAQTQGGQLRVQQQKLTKDFQGVLTDFKATQRSTAEKERMYVSKARSSKSGGGGGRGGSSGGGGGDEGLGASLVQQEHQQQQLQFENDVSAGELVIEQREEEIKAIETSILEVNEIFQDLAVIVHGQGQLIDNIETNVHNTLGQTEKTVEELTKASSSQQRSRRLMCCLLLTVATLVTVIVLVELLGRRD